MRLPWATSAAHSRSVQLPGAACATQILWANVATHRIVYAIDHAQRIIQIIAVDHWHGILL